MNEGWTDAVRNIAIGESAIYTGSEDLFSSIDQGRTWEEISISGFRKYEAITDIVVFRDSLFGHQYFRHLYFGRSG